MSGALQFHKDYSEARNFFAHPPTVPDVVKQLRVLDRFALITKSARHYLTQALEMANAGDLGIQEKSQKRPSRDDVKTWIESRSDAAERVLPLHKGDASVRNSRQITNTQAAVASAALARREGIFGVASSSSESIGAKKVESSGTPMFPAESKVSPAEQAFGALSPFDAVRQGKITLTKARAAKTDVKDGVTNST